jgi:hypothetical protein
MSGWFLKRRSRIWSRRRTSRSRPITGSKRPSFASATRSRRKGVLRGARRWSSLGRPAWPLARAIADVRAEGARGRCRRTRGSPPRVPDLLGEGVEQVLDAHGLGSCRAVTRARRGRADRAGAGSRRPRRRWPWAACAARPRPGCSPRSGRRRRGGTPRTRRDRARAGARAGGAASPRCAVARRRSAGRRRRPASASVVAGGAYSKTRSPRRQVGSSSRGCSGCVPWARATASSAASSAWSGKPRVARRGGSRSDSGLRRSGASRSRSVRSTRRYRPAVALPPGHEDHVGAWQEGRHAREERRRRHRAAGGVGQHPALAYERGVFVALQAELQDLTLSLVLGRREARVQARQARRQWVLRGEREGHELALRAGGVEDGRERVSAAGPSLLREVHEVRERGLVRTRRDEERRPRRGGRDGGLFPLREGGEPARHHEPRALEPIARLDEQHLAPLVALLGAEQASPALLEVANSCGEDLGVGRSERARLVGP